MTSEETFTSPEGGETAVPGPPPQIVVKPGWQSSEGQMVAGYVTAALLIAGLMGYKVSPEKVETLTQVAVLLAPVLLPLLAGALPLWNYITSRGKQKSNAYNATAQMQSALGWKDFAKIGVAVAPGLLPGKAGEVAREITGQGEAAEVKRALNEHGSLIYRLEQRVERVEKFMQMK